MRTIEWNSENQRLRMIDQRELPGELCYIEFEDHHQVIDAVRGMVVRGAPAIGAAAAFGLALAAFHSSASDPNRFRMDIDAAVEELKTARPTAVNLAWALERIQADISKHEGDVPELKARILALAQQIADEDVEINMRMAEHGAALIDDGDTIIHHCNTGALATVDWGTALGVIRKAHEQGKKIHVLVDETRPRLQGARLTAWELKQYGIPFDIITDNAAGYFLSSGQVQKIFVGADRVAANGDVANKIGTYMLALAARQSNVPLYSVVPTSTVDLSLSKGEQIPIEERDSSEVLGLHFLGKPASPEGVSARNPAFDVTPHHLISGIVTENGVVSPPFDVNLPKVIQK